MLVDESQREDGRLDGERDEHEVTYRRPEAREPGLHRRVGVEVPRERAAGERTESALVAQLTRQLPNASEQLHVLHEKPFSAVLGVPQLKVRERSAQLIGEDGSVVGCIESGDIVSIHGQTGELFLGSREIVS